MPWSFWSGVGYKSLRVVAALTSKHKKRALRGALLLTHSRMHLPAVHTSEAAKRSKGCCCCRRRGLFQVLYMRYGVAAQHTYDCPAVFRFGMKPGHGTTPRRASTSGSTCSPLYTVEPMAAATTPTAAAALGPRCWMMGGRWSCSVLTRCCACAAPLQRKRRGQW